MGNANVEGRISQFLSDQINLDSVEVGFNFFLTHRPDLKAQNEENARAELVKLLEGLNPKESPSPLDAAVKTYVNQIANLKSQ